MNDLGFIRDVRPAGELPPEEFRRLGYRVIDMMTDYFRSIETRPVLPSLTATEMQALFRADHLARLGESAETLLDDWEGRVLPNLTTIGSPRHFAYVIGSGTMLGALAEALAASVNTNTCAWKLGPAATEIERLTVRWLAELLGYPADCGGIFVSGATMANFSAILVALRNVAGYDSTAEGLQSDARDGRFLLYMSDHEGHCSVTRVADMLNLGRNAVRLVPSRSDFSLDCAALRRMLDEDIARGDRPLCVVAQIGSVNVGCIDPLAELADLCAEYGLWLHGDGACGAAGAMLPELQEHFRGIERLDSLTFDPHKWLAVPYDAGCLLVRDAEKLRRTFSISAPYLRGSLPSEYHGFDFLEYGPEMSRGFRALKVWMTLRHQGIEGLRSNLRSTIRQARYAHALVTAHPDFEALHEPLLYLYCFRYRPRDLAGEATDEYLDHLNQWVADQIQLSGLASVMTTKLRGRTVLRLSICSQRTTGRDIENVLETLSMIGGRAHRDRQADSSKPLRNTEPAFKQSGRSPVRKALP
jgi:aromatic-L-amino-acid/L-tryptophan decarboxylase